MLINIWESTNSGTPETGPYRLRDRVERATFYEVGDSTHYGEVVAILPTTMFSEGALQGVAVKRDPASAGTWAPDSVLRPPSSYDKVHLCPITVERFGFSEEPRLSGIYPILESENLTIEDVSSMITPKTFSVWQNGCFVSKETADALQNINYSIVRRYSSPTDRVEPLDGSSADIVSTAYACLSLIRPTRRSRVAIVGGKVAANGSLDPQTFRLESDPVDVPEVQKLYAIRSRDIDLLRSVLPEFMQLYRKNGAGQMVDEYEPIRMAVQLYQAGYRDNYWKAQHILWWAAIEALFGNAGDAVMARIYALFGERNLVAGYGCSIYEKEDIPSFFPPSVSNYQTLGQTVPLLHKVRNASAHGQKVPDLHFSSVLHPFGNTVVLLGVLAEAATFIIRKTVLYILQNGFREHFKDRQAREHFWTMQYAIPKNQGKHRLEQMEKLLRG